MVEEHGHDPRKNRNEDEDDEKEREIARLKQELEQMRRQQEEIMKMLAKLKEEKETLHKKHPSMRSADKATKITRKSDKISRKISRTARSFEQAANDLENVVEDFVTSLLGSIAASISHGARLVLDIGQPRAKSRRRVDAWSQIWRDLSHQEIPEEDLEDFLESMAQVANVLNDKHRIHLLKALERQPRYHDELSQITGLKGGQFRHHMTILKDNHLVVQERYRGRYILTPFGRSLLKLLEVLYLRYLSPKGSEDEPEEDGELEDNDENESQKNLESYKKIPIEAETDDDEHEQLNEHQKDENEERE